ncbi:TVP38/TMEM64 family protein [Microcoleus sp. FACHB-1515]|uniref:TVP38/TMEM64 family protein n=1 Tax=Cyanophyceae TaxID=3028117 RepID=UPI001683AC73|nr:TVP38/TMEM64 family protein [Microcoleus sp. FACHB-1515]MBD2090901.1 TVP38/TMEM64 family protein [Microcoleus sp. FACHB-1515]
MRPKLLRLLTHLNSLALLVLALCLLTSWRLVQNRNPIDWIRSIAALGFAGKLAYVGILMLAIVFSPIPGTPIVVAAGAVWQPLTAAIYGTIGIFVGCLMAYFLGRTLGRSVIRSLTGKMLHLSTHRGELYLGWVVFITHLLPIAPFDLISYAAGMAGLSFGIYAIATLLGTIPCVFFLAYMGASFTVNLTVGLAIAAVFLILLVVLPFGVQRYNWFGIKDSIRIE